MTPQPRGRVHSAEPRQWAWVSKVLDWKDESDAKRYSKRWDGLVVREKKKNPPLSAIYHE